MSEDRSTASSRIPVRRSAPRRAVCELRIGKEAVSSSLEAGRASSRMMAKRRQSLAAGEDLLCVKSRLDGASTLDETIASLIDLDANGLCLEWRNHLGGTPPAHLPRWRS
jgi:hypothetical protein